MYVYIYIYTYTYIYYIYICICICICIRTYTYTYLYTYDIHACMCEVRMYLYRALYALAMDWSPFEIQDSCHYGIVRYGMVSSVLLYHIKLYSVFVLYHYCVIFKLFTRS